jgi:hypothetical protein
VLLEETLFVEDRYHGGVLICWLLREEQPLDDFGEFVYLLDGWGNFTSSSLFAVANNVAEESLTFLIELLSSAIAEVVDNDSRVGKGFVRVRKALTAAGSNESFIVFEEDQQDQVAELVSHSLHLERKMSAQKEEDVDEEVADAIQDSHW